MAVLAGHSRAAYRNRTDDLFITSEPTSMPETSAGYRPLVSLQVKRQIGCRSRPPILALSGYRPRRPGSQRSPRPEVLS